MDNGIDLATMSIMISIVANFFFYFFFKKEKYINIKNSINNKLKL